MSLLWRRCLRSLCVTLGCAGLAACYLGIAGAQGAAAAAPFTAPFTQCPAIGADPSCGILLVVNPDNSVTVMGDPSVGPFDGGDDTLVGIANTSASTVYAITVSGPGSGLSEFDGDGICSGAYGSWIGEAGCPYGPTGYEGPGTTFVTEPGDPDAAEVDFNPNLGPGQSAYFSLEGALTSAVLTARKGQLVNRYVALGDSVPYGHGLSNPYPTARPGATGTSQGPSPQAYPSLLATALGLDIGTVRSTDCLLGGDQLAVSGAPAASADSKQAPGPSDFQCNPLSAFPTDLKFSVQGVQEPLANLASNPPALVTIQAGADDIDFGDCLMHDIVPGLNLVSGVLRIGCVAGGQVTAAVGQELATVTTSLVATLEAVSPNAQQVAVLNYYDPIPAPNDFSGASTHSGASVNPVCLLLSTNKASTYKDSLVIQTALNAAISQAVIYVRNHGFLNVKLIDISSVFAHHEMCTGDPAVFSGELMSDVRLTEDIGTLEVCYSVGLLARLVGFSQAAACASALNDIEDYTWRAAHPNQFGQQDIANYVLPQLPPLADGPVLTTPPPT